MSSHYGDYLALVIEARQRRFEAEWHEADLYLALDEELDETMFREVVREAGLSHREARRLARSRSLETRSGGRSAEYRDMIRRKDWAALVPPELREAHLSPRFQAQKARLES